MPRACTDTALLGPFSQTILLPSLTKPTSLPPAPTTDPAISPLLSMAMVVVLANPAMFTSVNLCLLMS
jgi:hypothetical protein